MSDWELCEKHDTLMLVYNEYIKTSVTILLCLTMLPLSYIYVHRYMQGKLELSSLAFYGGIIFYLSIFSTMIFSALTSLHYCRTAEHRLFWWKLSTYTYLLQGGMLLILLFDRLYTVFANTSFGLSKCTIRAFIACWVFTVILTVVALSDLALFPLAALSFLIYVILTIWLNGLFISRLLRIYTRSKDVQHITEADEQKTLVHLATKIAILCFVSTPFPLLFVMSMLLRMVLMSPHLVLGSTLIFVLDLYTNFMSIWLSAECFDAWYMRVCGCCDRRCHSCWQKCVNGRGDEHAVSVESVSGVQRDIVVMQMSKSKSSVSDWRSNSPEIEMAEV